LGAPTTVSLWELGLDPNMTLSSGQIIGTGSMSTTYIIEGADTDSVTAYPFTMTLVEDSNDFIETVAIPGEAVGVELNCTLSRGQSDCAIVGDVSSLASTITMPIFIPETAILTQVAVPVSTAIPPSSTQPLATVDIPKLSSARLTSCAGVTLGFVFAGLACVLNHFSPLT